MSKITNSVLEVFAASATAAANLTSQIEVGRVGRPLSANEFSGANGSEGNLVPSDQETPQSQAPSDPSDQFPAKDGFERLSAEKIAVSEFGETYTLVREIWALPGERAFHLDRGPRARTRLADACPPGIDPIRWRHAIEAAGILVAKVKDGDGPVITFRDLVTGEPRAARLASIGDRPAPEQGDQALSRKPARARDEVEGT